MSASSSRKRASGIFHFYIDEGDLWRQLLYQWSERTKKGRAALVSFFDCFHTQLVTWWRKQKLKIIKANCYKFLTTNNYLIWRRRFHPTSAGRKLERWTICTLKWKFYKNEDFPPLHLPFNFLPLELISNWNCWRGMLRPASVKFVNPKTNNHKKQ